MAQTSKAACEMAERLAREAGAEIEHCRSKKHPYIVVSLNGHRRRVGFALTASDWRSNLNSRSVLKRALREMASLPPAQPAAE